jgi:hypothetical protein
MSYRTYVKLAPDGTVNSHIVTAGTVPEGYFEITDPDQVRMVQRGQNRVVFDGQRFRPKRPLQLVVDRRTFLADGVEMVTVRIEGDVGEQKTVRVMVGNRVVDVPVGEPLEISTRAAGRISVRLKEQLFVAEPIVVDAIEVEVTDASGAERE